MLFNLTLLLFLCVCKLSRTFQTSLRLAFILGYVNLENVLLEGEKILFPLFQQCIKNWTRPLLILALFWNHLISFPFLSAYLRNEEQFEDVEVVVGGRSAVRIERGHERAEKLFLHYIQRWAKDYLRRRLDWVIEDLYGRSEYTSNTSPRHLR